MTDVLVLGDAHGEDPDRCRRLLDAYRATDAPVALQLGDLEYYSLPRRTYFIAGNNEDQDVIAALRAGKRPAGVEHATLLASEAVAIEGRRIAGLSGNYAPTQYEKDRSELRQGRRRHFTHQDIERALELREIDVLLTHEAPHGVVDTENYPVGCTHVDRLLRELEPALCLVGHHHEHIEGTFGATRVVSLAPAWEGYYLLNPSDLTLSWHPMDGT